MTQMLDRGDFPRQADGYRKELLAHCYRMSGSVHEAEDLVQETYLRAWRAYDGFEQRSSLRTWLYRIATNVCLTALAGRPRRPLPVGLGAAGSQAGDQLTEDLEVPWLQPIPDAAVDTDAPNADPAAVAVSREGIRLAFIAAIQFLPPRQRAVLILREVVGWKAAEVAAAVGTSTAAVNSLLQRARAELDRVAPSADGLAEPADPAVRALLDQYVEAFWTKDIATLVRMFTQDAIWEMPPFHQWYRGADNIGALIGTQCPGNAGDMKLVGCQANGQPAFGLYMRHPEGGFRPFHLQVLEIREGRVAHVAAFFDLSLFATFGLPESLPD